MKLLSNLKILTEKNSLYHKFTFSKRYTVNSRVLEVLTDVDRHLTESNNLFIESVEMDSKKENWKKISEK